MSPSCPTGTSARTSWPTPWPGSRPRFWTSCRPDRSWLARQNASGRGARQAGAPRSLASRLPSHCTTDHTKVAVPDTPFVSVAVTVIVYVPSVVPEPEMVPFDAIEMPGGSPVAVKVRVWAELESTADIGNETAVPFGLTAVWGAEVPAPEVPAATWPVRVWPRLVDPVSGRLLEASPTLIEY